MSVVKMSKISVLGLQSERSEILKGLMAMGAVEITDGSPEDTEGEQYGIKTPVQSELSKLDAVIADIGLSIDLLKRYGSYKSPFFAKRRTIDEQDFHSVMEKRNTLLETSGRIKSLEEAIIRLKGDENKVKGLIVSLSPWLSTELALETDSTRLTFIHTGTLPHLTDLATLERELEESAPESMLQQAGFDREHRYLVVAGHKDKESEIMSLLKAKGWNRIVFRDMSGTARENKVRLEKQLLAIDNERKKLAEAIVALAGEREKLEVLHDAYVMERCRLEAHGRLVSTRSVFLLEGWVPTELSLKVKGWLTKEFICSVEINEPEEDEAYPVLIENGPVVESIRPVLTMYGLPSSKELDPSPIMMPFFCLFFGMMLGDGGYGLLMALVAGILVWRIKMEDGPRRFIKLLMWCGLSSVFWGLMFGSWFGISALSKTALWMNPVENPDLMMSWAILFGIIHMFFGFGVKGANLLRKKKYLDFVFDVLFIYLLYIGFALTLLPFAPGVNTEGLDWLTSLGNKLLLLGVILLLLTQGRKSPKLFGKIFGGVGKLYDLIGFLSDCLSYTRLVALGLASAIIGDIVNTLSATMGGNIVVRIIASSLIIIVGHSINIGLNVLGAFVHSCRLQYLEFFGKFLEGGGEAFRPFQANTRYIVVKTATERVLSAEAPAA